jgi:hypothetical protein
MGRFLAICEDDYLLRKHVITVSHDASKPNAFIEHHKNIYGIASRVSANLVRNRTTENEQTFAILVVTETILFGILNILKQWNT